MGAGEQGGRDLPGNGTEPGQHGSGEIHPGARKGVLIQRGEGKPSAAGERFWTTSRTMEAYSDTHHTA